MDFRPLINLCESTNTKYLINGKTAPLTSIRVGNTAKLIVFPTEMHVFCQIIDNILTNNYKYVILGNGTNSYFCDVYDGVVVVTNGIDTVLVSENDMIATCGASLKNCANNALCHSLAGLEFAYGIPGTIGGALYMNAEAFGSTIGQFVVKSVVYDTLTRQISELSSNESHLFGKKCSIFSAKRYILLETTLRLTPSTFDFVKNKTCELLKKRNSSQPLDMPSAGSAFKRNGNYYVSKLIDEAGLKGFRIGGAEVSKKHAGFIVNSSGATANDINKLIEYIKHKIYDKYQINLIEEIIYIE